MIRTLFGTFILFALTFAGSPKAQAQTIELLAGNTLNGAMNGTILGGATMALNNSTEFGPLRVGVGLGTLYGLGIGAYDVSNSKGNPIMVSGVFNDGDNTSILVLLDTFYGAAGGAIVATSVMLIANEPLIDGLKYGSATGAWIGFGVGIIDAFLLSKRSSASSVAGIPSPSMVASGLVGVKFNDSTSMGFLSPTLVQTFQSKTDLSQAFTQIDPAVEVINFRINL